MLIYLGKVDLSYSEKAVLELPVLGPCPCPRKGIGCTTFGYEQRSSLIALLTISLVPVLTLEIELFAISMLGGCHFAML